MDKLYQYMHPIDVLNNRCSAQPVVIGSCAWEIIQHNQNGTILGITSKGIFLLFSGQRIVFLSNEEYRGPLTINFPGIILPETTVGEFVEIQDQFLMIAGTQVDLHVQPAQIWQTGKPAGPVAQPEQLSRLDKVAGLVIEAKDGAGLTPLLILLLGMQSTAVISEQVSKIMPVIERTKVELSEQKYVEVIFTLAPLFGLGAGLTPSGDDLILGLLLGLNRFPDLFCSYDALPEVNQTAIGLARKKTTSLSASLIECGCQGQADERLIKGLDGILSGSPDVDGCARALCSWGNSSGVDTLVGLALLLVSHRKM